MPSPAYVFFRGVNIRDLAQNEEGYLDLYSPRFQQQKRSLVLSRSATVAAAQKKLRRESVRLNQNVLPRP